MIIKNVKKKCVVKSIKLVLPPIICICRLLYEIPRLDFYIYVLLNRFAIRVVKYKGTNINYLTLTLIFEKTDVKDLKTLNCHFTLVRKLMKTRCEVIYLNYNFNSILINCVFTM